MTKSRTKETTFSRYGFEIGIKLELLIATCGTPSRKQLGETLEKINPQIKWGKSREIPAGENEGLNNATKALFFPFDPRQNSIATSNNIEHLEECLLSKGNNGELYAQLEEIAEKVMQKRKQSRPNVISAQIVILSSIEVGGEVFTNGS